MVFLCFALTACTWQNSENNPSAFFAKFKEGSLPFLFDKDQYSLYNEEIYVDSLNGYRRNVFQLIDSTDRQFLAESFFQHKQWQVRPLALFKFPLKSGNALVLVNKALLDSSHRYNTSTIGHSLELLTYKKDGSMIDSLTVGGGILDNWIKYFEISNSFQIDLKRIDFVDTDSLGNYCKVTQEKFRLNDEGKFIRLNSITSKSTRCE